MLKCKNGRKVRLALGLSLMAAMMLTLSCTAYAKDKKAYACKKYNIDGVSGKDTMVVREKPTEDGYDTGLLTFEVNGKSAGTYDCTDDNLYVEGYQLVRTASKDFFLIVSASEGDDFSPQFRQSGTSAHLRALRFTAHACGNEVTSMTPHGKKMIAPIIITFVFLMYLLFYGALVMPAALEQPLVILLGIPLVLLGAGMVYVLITRIREIRSGEEDDLDNY